MSDDGTEQSPPQETPMVNGGGKPLLSRIFAALANRRRRYVLYHLRDHQQATIDDLAVQIAAWEHDVPISDAPAEDVNRIYTALVHSHLPKLAEYGLVEYDRRTDTVCYTYPPSLLDDAIDLTAALEKPP